MADLKRVKGDSYYGKIAANYQKRRQKQGWWPVEQQAVQDLLEKLPDDLSVADIPFGTGRFVPIYLEKNYQVYGLDASDAMLAQSKIELGEEVFAQCQLRRGFSTDLPYDDKQFDLLLSCRFLRDIITFKDAKKSLLEFARVTEGHAILQLGEEIKPTDDYPENNERMGSRLSAKQMRNFLLDYGFEILEKRSVNKVDDENSNIHFYLCRVLK